MESKIKLQFVTEESQNEEIKKKAAEENENLLQINKLYAKINKLSAKMNELLEKNTELNEKCEKSSIISLQKEKEIEEIKIKLSQIEKKKDELKEDNGKLQSFEEKILALKSILNEECTVSSAVTSQPSQSSPDKLNQQKLSNIIRIVVISNFSTSDERSRDIMENVQNLTRLGFNIEVFDFFCFTDQNAQALLKTKSATWKENNVECFFLFTAAAIFQPWLGDFLYDQHVLGLGVIICKNCINNDSNGVCGKFEDVLPIIKGPSKKDDGPLPLALKMGLGQPCFGDSAAASYDLIRDITTFDGGKYANRSEIKPKKAKENEIIDLFASWGDAKHTPLIVTKRYIGAEKSSWGRIVILNFWPISSELNLVNWEVRKDGVKMMQYFVIWVSKRLESLMNTKKQTETESEIPDISAIVEKEVKRKLKQMFESVGL